MAAEDVANLVGLLCEAGVDFIKDDEVCANPDHAPLAGRVPAVMRQVRAYRERTGRDVMIAFNITDEMDAMRRHADLVEKEGGSCVMASLNWCGLSALQTLRRSTPLALHGHRNGFGAFARHPALGIGFDAYQALYRLAGIDHMHVHGIGGKFSDSAQDVSSAARRCGERRGCRVAGILLRPVGGHTACHLRYRRIGGLHVPRWRRDIGPSRWASGGGEEPPAGL